MTYAQKKRPALRLASLLVFAALLIGLAVPLASAEENKETHTATCVEATEEASGAWKSVVTTEETVSYQVGGNTISVHRVETVRYTEPASGTENTEVYDRVQTYTLSQPLTSARQEGEWNLVLDVPAGTIVTCSGNTTFRWKNEDGEGENNWSVEGMEWHTVNRVLQTHTINWTDEQRAAILDYGDGESLSVQKDVLYQLVDNGEETEEVPGGLVFHGI